MKSAQTNGFTLIELMITIGVLAVVAAIAVPAYKGYIETSRLTEGWNNLYALNAAEQQYFLENGSYFAGADAAALKANSVNLWIRAETDAAANFTYVVDNVTATDYRATATGTNKVATSVKLRCTMTSGQSVCVKL